MQGRTLIISSDRLGCGDGKLGAQLMGNFLRRLWSLEVKPARMVFYNGGVQLLAEGSPVLDALCGLDQAGVDLVACSTCVTFFESKDKLVVGRISDMTGIATTVVNSDSVVTV